MIHRYEGNTGRMRRYPEHTEHTPSEAAPESRAERRPSAGQLPSSLTGLIDRLLPSHGAAPETGDVLLLLILLLLYRESGDTELLMILGAMLFL